METKAPDAIMAPGASFPTTVPIFSGLQTIFSCDPPFAFYYISFLGSPPNGLDKRQGELLNIARFGQGGSLVRLIVC